MVEMEDWPAVQSKHLYNIDDRCFFNISTRLAIVQSSPRPEPLLETVKKTRPYGPVNWDHSPDRKIRTGLGKK